MEFHLDTQDNMISRSTNRDINNTENNDYVKSKINNILSPLKIIYIGVHLFVNLIAFYDTNAEIASEEIRETRIFFQHNINKKL